MTDCHLVCSHTGSGLCKSQFSLDSKAKNVIPLYRNRHVKAGHCYSRPDNLTLFRAPRRLIQTHNVQFSICEAQSLSDVMNMKHKVSENTDHVWFHMGCELYVYIGGSLKPSVSHTDG